MGLRVLWYKVSQLYYDLRHVYLGSNEVLLTDPRWVDEFGPLSDEDLKVF